MRSGVLLISPTQKTATDRGNNIDESQIMLSEKRQMKKTA